VVGLEAVRRDWPDLAHRLQEGMLERLFTGRDPAPFVRELVDALRAGALDAELVYAKRVRKGALERYEANAPHVQAARKAGHVPGGVIRYVITRSGPEPVLPGAALPPAIDHAHYVEKVVRPVAESILEVLGSSFDEALGAPQQLSLL
jgi:DNA polymerase-2